MKKVFYLTGAIVAASAFFMQNDGDLSLELAKAESGIATGHKFDGRCSGGNKMCDDPNNRLTLKTGGPWVLNH